MHRMLAPLLAAIGGILYAGAAWPGVFLRTEAVLTGKAGFRIEVLDREGIGGSLVLSVSTTETPRFAAPCDQVK